MNNLYLKTKTTSHSSIISERCECLIAFALIVSYARSDIGAVDLVQIDQLCSPLQLRLFGITHRGKQNIGRDNNLLERATNDVDR